MAYRIEYDTKVGKYEIRQNPPTGFPVLLAAVLVLFLAVTFLFWEDGAAVLKDVLIPGDDAVTILALQTMTEELKSGVPVRDALAAFCSDVIHGAEISH